MKIDRKYFCFYETFYNQIKVLPKDKQAEYIFTVCEYAFNGVEPDFTDIELALWVGMKDAIDGQRSRSEANKEKLKAYREQKKQNEQNEQLQNVRNVRNKTNAEEEEKEYEYEYEYEYEKENEEEKENAKSNDLDKKTKKQKHKYSSFNNVLLTDEEFEKLKSSVEDVNSLLEFYAECKAMKGYTYKSDYLAIKKWGIEAFQEQMQKKKIDFQSLKFGSEPKCCLCGGKLDGEQKCVSCAFPEYYRNDDEVLSFVLDVKQNAQNFKACNQYIFKDYDRMNVIQRAQEILAKQGENR